MSDSLNCNVQLLHLPQYKVNSGSPVDLSPLKLDDHVIIYRISFTSSRFQTLHEWFVAGLPGRNWNISTLVTHGEDTRPVLWMPYSLHVSGVLGYLIESASFSAVSTQKTLWFNLSIDNYSRWLSLVGSLQSAKTEFGYSQPLRELCIIAYKLGNVGNLPSHPWSIFSPNLMISLLLVNTSSEVGWSLMEQSGSLSHAQSPMSSG